MESVHVDLIARYGRCIDAAVEEKVPRRVDNRIVDERDAECSEESGNRGKHIENGTCRDGDVYHD